ncbi:MAG: ISL3 family transposase [Verrucomicrobiales bacterium]
MRDLEGKGVLQMVEKREEESLQQAYESLGAEVKAGVEAVAMDMWRAYIKATGEQLPQAEIVHDKFHVSGFLGEAVDKVRRSEHKQLKKEGDQTLTGSKYLWLMDPRNLTEAQEEEFATLLSANLKAGKAWALKETFVQFWNCPEAKGAERLFARWYGKAKRSRLKPVMEAAEKIKRHLANIVTYFEHRITNATAEGINSFIQAIKSNARGFRRFESYRIAVLFYRKARHVSLRNPYECLKSVFSEA